MRKGKSLAYGEYMRNIRIIQFMVADAICIALTYALAIIAMIIPPFSDSIGPEQIRMALIVLPIIVGFKILVYYFADMYKLVLDNVGLDEVFRIFIAVIVTDLAVFLFFFVIRDFYFIPDLLFIFTAVFEAILLSATRMLKRIIRYLSYKQKPHGGKRTLLVGAGAGGKLVCDEIRNNEELTNYPVAFVDDDPMKIGKIMSGLQVYGPVAKIPELIDELKIEEVIIAIANISSERFQEIIKIIAERPVKIKRLPKFKELKKESPKTLLEVNVEDLLSRDVIDLDAPGIRGFIQGKRVMITGAGGSIGSELVRQIVMYEPAEVMLVDIYENGVYDLQMELNRHFAEEGVTPIKRTVLIASVYNYDRMKTIFTRFQPELLFHAAAYKHVPLMEDSAIEAVRTNVLGTYNIARLCDEFHVSKMVLVSSDKAVRPTNVMGATKRFAEMILQHWESKSETKYSAVRFGNVLGSNGSVVPLFKRQIEAGGPVTVTDRNIIRYFMTIPEAVGLILQSGTYASGGETFILDMGEPVRIIDLAEKMIMLSGRRPYIDIDIKITGLRPGEKLFEELLVDKTMDHISTAHKKIFIERTQDPKDIDAEVEFIRSAFEGLDNLEIKELVHKFVPTYTIKE
ncbi:MAG TPA: nucleoside-diphosphate sugar epimerase [Acholeplasmatales bacterium]|nr:nucleoside-diphosphate sugar epimerase [Acholeplasmatales bacterium]